MYGENRFGTTRWGVSDVKHIFMLSGIAQAQGSTSAVPVVIFVTAGTLDAQGEAVTTPAAIYVSSGVADALGEASGSPVRMKFVGEIPACAEGVTSLVPIRVRGESFTFSGDIAVGEILRIDTDKMTVKLDGVNVRANFDGDFWEIISGLQDITYSDEEESRTLELVVTRKDRKV